MSVFGRVLTATRRTLFYLTTSKLTSRQLSLCLKQQVRHPPCTTSVINLHVSRLWISCVQCFSIFPARVLNSVLSVACSLLIKSLMIFFARTVNLMIDIPRLSPSSVTKVLLRIANASFKTLIILCIFSDRVLKSSLCTSFIQLIAKQYHCNAFHVSVWRRVWFPQIVPILMFYHISAQEKVSKQRFTEYDVIRSCLWHTKLHSHAMKETK